MFGMQFNLIPEKESFTRYRDRLTAREAFRRGAELDEKAQAAIQPAQPQPA
jgi:hypothetical protein